MVAEEPGSETLSLKGITQVEVDVFVDDDGQKLGLPADAVKSAIVSGLKKHGISVVEKSDQFLVVEVSTVIAKDVGCSSTRFELYQPTKLSNGQLTFCPTYQQSKLDLFLTAPTTNGDTGQKVIAKTIGVLNAKFIQDFQKANGVNAAAPSN